MWRFQGNKVQFDFNSDMVDIVKRSIWALENAKFDYCKCRSVKWLIKFTNVTSLYVLLILQVVAGKLFPSMNRIRLPATLKMRAKFTKWRGERKRKRSSSRGRSSRGRDYGTLVVASGPRTWGTPTMSTQECGFQPSVRGRLFRPKFVSA